MEEGDVDSVARLLSQMKDSLVDLESALKKKDSDKISAAKRKMMELQMEISRRL